MSLSVAPDNNSFVSGACDASAKVSSSGVWEEVRGRGCKLQLFVEYLCMGGWSLFCYFTTVYCGVSLCVVCFYLSVCLCVHVCLHGLVGACLYILVTIHCIVSCVGWSCFVFYYMCFSFIYLLFDCMCFSSFISLLFHVLLLLSFPN